MKRAKFKKYKPKREKKFVKINDKTLIEVDLNMSDDTARKEYLEKIAKSKPTKKEIQEDLYLVRKSL